MDCDGLGTLGGGSQVGERSGEEDADGKEGEVQVSWEACVAVLDWKRGAAKGGGLGMWLGGGCWREGGSACGVRDRLLWYAGLQLRDEVEVGGLIRERQEKERGRGGDQCPLRRCGEIVFGSNPFAVAAEECGFVGGWREYKSFPRRAVGCGAVVLEAWMCGD